MPFAGLAAVTHAQTEGDLAKQLANPSYSLNDEATFDHESDVWTVPLNFTVSEVARLGSQRVSFGGGLKWFADGPDGAPTWGIRAFITLLYPR